MTETLDERAERLALLGLQLAERIREDDPAAVRRTIAALPADEQTDLAVLLAAHVPIDLPRSVLIGWWEHHPQSGGLKPCGTLAAAKRHQARGEQLDPACQWTLREHERVRKRERREAA